MKKVPYQIDLEQRLNAALKKHVRAGTEIKVSPEWLGPYLNTHYEISMVLSIPTKEEELKKLDIRKIYKDIARELKIDIKANPKTKYNHDKSYILERFLKENDKNGLTIIKANFESGELTIVLEKERCPAKDGNWKPLQQAMADIDVIIEKLPGIMQKVSKMSVKDHEVESLFERVSEKLAGCELGLRKREFYGKEKMIKGVMGFGDNTEYFKTWCNELEKAILGKPARAGGGIKPVIERTNSNMPGQLYKFNIQMGIDCARKLDEMKKEDIEQAFKDAGAEAVKGLGSNKVKSRRR